MEWFLKKKIGHLPCCANLFVIGHQFQNITLKCYFLTWRWASENFDFYPKMGNTIFWSLQAQWRNVFFEFLKATNEEKLKKICFSVDQVNTVLTNFGGLKKVQRILFQIFSWALLFEKKKHFFENKTFNVRSFKFFWTILLRAQPNLPFFKGLNSKKYIWSAAMRPISKSQKVLVHLTLMHIVACW